MRKSIFVLAVLFGLAGVISSCSKKDVPGANEVWMQNTAFVPNSITISVNSTVTWTNKDNMTHNVTSDSGWFVSGNISAGSTYSRQFTTAGTYSYRCTIHPGMNGTVIVH